MSQRVKETDPVCPANACSGKSVASVQGDLAISINITNVCNLQTSNFTSGNLSCRYAHAQSGLCTVFLFADLLVIVQDRKQ